MGLWNKIFKKTQTFNSSADLAVLEKFSSLLRLTDSYSSLAKSGYMENVIANTCIRRIAQAINSIPIQFYLDGELVEEDTQNKQIRSIMDAFNDPDPDYDKCLLIESIYSQQKIDGNAYVYIPEDTLDRITGLRYLRPDKVTYTQKSDEKVRQYRFSNGSEQFEFERENYRINGERFENPESLDGRFNLVIFRNFHPLSDIRGLSNLTPAALGIDGHNAALEWNNEVMSNSGKLSGILSSGSPDGGGMTPDQIDQLSNRLKAQTTGKKNGSILVMNNPAKFDKFSMTSQEMDFIDGIVQRATDICNALDYPPYLLGFTGATFSNQAEAKLSLYENTAIPEAMKIYGNIAAFLSRKYDINLKIKLDISRVPAMAPRFAELNGNIIGQFQANLITQSEAREKLDYESLKDSADLFHADFSKTPDFNQPET